MLIVSNDRDLCQLVDEKVSIMQIPFARGFTSLQPYRVITLAGYLKQRRINPYIAPLFDALRGKCSKLNYLLTS